MPITSRSRNVFRPFSSTETSTDVQTETTKSVRSHGGILVHTVATTAGDTIGEIELSHPACLDSCTRQAAPDDGSTTSSVREPQRQEQTTNNVWRGRGGGGGQPKGAKHIKTKTWRTRTRTDLGMIHGGDTKNTKSWPASTLWTHPYRLS